MYIVYCITAVLCRGVLAHNQYNCPQSMHAINFHLQTVQYQATHMITVCVCVWQVYTLPGLALEYSCMQFVFTAAMNTSQQTRGLIS